MLFLMLQTFAWMLLAGLIGAALGCFARRTFAPVAADMPLAGGGATGAALATAGAAVATAGPVIEAARAPAPVVPEPVTPAPVTSEAAAPHEYGITTVGIPRAMPEPVQPKIQPLDLPLAAGGGAAGVGTPPAAVKIVQTGVGSTTYPITTIGIPPAVPPPFPPSAATGAALAAVRADTERFARALAGTIDPQPRPEPLRPELARGAAEPSGAVAAVAVAVAVAPAVGVIAATPVAAAPVAATMTDDFTRIRAIDPELQRRLNALGVVRFADLAKLTTADVARLSETLGLLGRIEQENWIEQAQILSSGGDTYYSRRRQRGEIPAAAPVWAQEAPAPTAVAAAPSTVAPVPTPAPPSTPTMQAESAAAAAAAAAGSVAMGITSDAATADGMRGRSDLSGLRSVRAEALRSDITASEMLRSIGAPRPITQIDDLKRVRGIGVLIEKKLNSVGITTYEQIANWTRADIDRVSQLLDFKGRIERENWVEQARILASGGSTDFSRRVDRGEA